MCVKSITARWILDSRGFPTTECTVTMDCGAQFVACVPSGASTGTKEAVELRDGDKNAFHGKGVSKAVEAINEVIAPHLIALFDADKLDVCDQKAVDGAMNALDKTANKSKLGANAILAVSQAICRAAAGKKGVPLYKHINDLAKQLDPKIGIAIPNMFFNVINGGKHASNELECQEIMFTILNKKTPQEVVQKASEVFHTLKSLIAKKGLSTNVGDEGGFAPQVNLDDGISLILEAAKINSCENDLKIGFDFAASEFEAKPNTGKYNFKSNSSDTKPVKNAAELEAFYLGLLKKYPQIVSIEDPYSEFDGKSYGSLLAKIRDPASGLHCQIVADDLTVTNCDIIARSIESKDADALLVKMNQIGTVSEAIQASHLATKAGWTLMVSHRSGETTDAFVADFAVGVNAEACKFGAPSRGERVAKYNRLMQIGGEAKYGMHQHKFC